MSGFGARTMSRNVREYSVGEEIANSITHGIGALLAIAAIPITIVKAVRDGGGVLLFCALVYTIFMLLEYVASTLYHALRPDGAKRVFKVLDHSFIYLFIAASYTPYCLVTLADIGGWPLFFIVWALAIAGVAAEAFWVFRPRWVNAVLYLLLGWAVVWFIPALYSLLPPGLLAARRRRHLLFHRLHLLRPEEGPLLPRRLPRLHPGRHHPAVLQHPALRAVMPQSAPCRQEKLRGPGSTMQRPWGSVRTQQRTTSERIAPESTHPTHRQSDKRRAPVG